MDGCKDRGHQDRWMDGRMEQNMADGDLRMWLILSLTRGIARYARFFFGKGRKRDERTNTHRWVGRKRDERTNGRTHIV